MINASHNYQNNGSFMNTLGGPSGVNAGISEQILFEVEPIVFTGLRTGGVQNKFLVDAIVFFDGMKFKATGRSWRPVSFSQK
jgi:hypothetical protein